MGQRLADRDYVISWFCGYRFVIFQVVVWDTWLDQTNSKTMILGTFLLQIINAVLNKA